MMTHTPFTAGQLNALRSSYGQLETVSPDRLVAFHHIFDGCADVRLQQLATARIKFVSKLAINACTRRGFDYVSGEPIVEVR